MAPAPTGRPHIDFLNNETVPSRGIAFQAFTDHNYMGPATEIYNGEGFYDLGINATSYVWIPNDSDCCVTFCQSKKNTTQWWCRERFQQESSGPFPRLGVLCGTDFDRDYGSHWCAPEEEAEAETNGTDKARTNGTDKARTNDTDRAKDKDDEDDDGAERGARRSVVLF